MTEAMFANEPQFRIAIFLGGLIAMAVWENVAPRRPRSISRIIRWTSNLGVVAVGTILVRLIVPTTVTGFALLARERGWGLFTNWDTPEWFAFALSVVLLDLAIYLQHIMFHAVPALWRLHRMHHADLEFDVTTGLRFHPVEILLSIGIKFAVIAVIGPPAVAVLLFEVLLNATSMFNHSNLRLPQKIDRILRCYVVTPDMHRIHHSIHSDETNSNFGFNLPWWDRLLGTYRDQPKDGHEGMIIGVKQFRTIKDLRLDRMLIQPLHGPEVT